MRNRFPRTRPNRLRVRAAVAAVAALGIAATGVPAAFSETGHAGSTNRADDPVQKDVDALVRQDGFPGVEVAVTRRDGTKHDYTAGVGDRATGTPVPTNGRVRIGSATKSFTAAVVLQLVGEGKVKLDEPIETYLPGLIRGDGIDGTKITVRNLLQHTSGLPDYTDYIPKLAGLGFRDTYSEPYELLNLALAHKAAFAPGTQWAYSNTNYVVAGLMVQKITGRPLGEEITDRIIRPLGLHDTYWPGIGDESIRGLHATGYHSTEPGGPLQDITELDPSWGWAAGQLISTPRDLNHFYSALVGGKVLAPAELEEMQTTHTVPGAPDTTGYGLGLSKTRLSCGIDMWGHPGGIHGYETVDGVTTDGRAVTATVTAISATLSADPDKVAAAEEHLSELLDDAICE